MAVDPGGTIGISVGPSTLLTIPEGLWGGLSELNTWQLRREPWREWRDPDVAVVMRILVGFRKLRCSLLIVESWESRPRIVLKGGDEALSSHTQASMLQFAFAQKWMDNRLHFQSASQGKSIWNDDRLKKVGLFRTPKTTWRHANDATRHYLMFLRRVQNGEVKL